MVLLLLPATNVAAQCVPDCMFAMCGDSDGCGGLCDGPCANPAMECIDGVCQDPACEPNCANKPCGGADGCGGICEQGYCVPGYVCINGICQTPPPVCGDGIVEGDEECDSTTNCGEDCTCVEGYEPQAGDCLKALTCKGFYPPFDVTLELKGKVNRAIPLRIQLFHMDTLVTDADISAPPVVNINYYPGSWEEGVDASDALEPLGHANEGNAFRYEPSGYWIYHLGTKQCSAPGTYEVTVSAGDTSYLIVEPVGYFTRLP